MQANFSYPTEIRFGAGRIAELPKACQMVGITRPLLVTDRGMADLPITGQALALLQGAGLAAQIFCDVDPNPTDRNLEAGLDILKQRWFQ